MCYRMARLGDHGASSCHDEGVILLVVFLDVYHCLQAKKMHRRYRLPG